jgi:hypothetical protein
MGEYITSRQERILTEPLQMNDMPILINEEDEDESTIDGLGADDGNSNDATNSNNPLGAVSSSTASSNATLQANLNSNSLATRLFARFWKWRKVFYSIFGVCFVIIVGSLFSVLHMGMDVPTAFYFSIVTSTTGTFRKYIYINVSLFCFLHFLLFVCGFNFSHNFV